MVLRAHAVFHVRGSALSSVSRDISLCRWSALPFPVNHPFAFLAATTSLLSSFALASPSIYFRTSSASFPDRTGNAHPCRARLPSPTAPLPLPPRCAALRLRIPLPFPPSSATANNAYILYVSAAARDVAMSRYRDAGSRRDATNHRPTISSSSSSHLRHGGAASPSNLPSPADGQDGRRERSPGAVCCCCRSRNVDADAAATAPTPPT